MNEIAKNMKELRAGKGFSLRELGEQIGISHNTLAQYERNDVVPTVTNALKIAEFYQVPMEYLVYGKKVITDFEDAQLLRLFRELDGFPASDRKIAKKFLGKLVKNVQERLGLESEV
jgi:transcriptional regulator with XRE-family HTH domain